MAHTISFIHIFHLFILQFTAKGSDLLGILQHATDRGKTRAIYCVFPLLPFPLSVFNQKPLFVLFREGEEERALPRKTSRNKLSKGLKFLGESISVFHL
jgi:hypothetical protein